MGFRRLQFWGLWGACLAGLAGLAASAAVGQIASPVRDINTFVEAWPFPRIGMGVEELTAVGNRVFFKGTLASTATEVWATDGTDLGTHLLRDICPGPCRSEPRFLGAVGNHIMLWIAQSSSSERALWRSDGTIAGTYALTGSEPGPLEAPPDDVHAFFRGRFYFPSCTSGHCALWATDGTRAGTSRVAEQGYPSRITATAERLFFFLGQELYASDGTAAGTSPLRRFEGEVRAVTAAGNKLFFIARDQGDEVWVSDGTVAGTRPVTQFIPAQPFADYSPWLKAAGDRVYFVADDVVHGEEIWESDGTAAGTRRVTEFGFNEPFPYNNATTSLATAGRRLVFLASDGLSPLKLWVTSGTPESTTALPLPAGCDADCRFVSDSTRLYSVGDRVVFAGTDAAAGAELWASDGTASGTRRVADFCPGPCSSLEDTSQIRVRAWPGGVLLVARVSANDWSEQVWFSDGTAAGTKRKTGLPERGEVYHSYHGPDAAALGDRLFTVGSVPNHSENLWVSEGSPPSTRPALHSRLNGPTSQPRDLIALGDRVLFVACDGTGLSPWTSNGSPETTHSLGGASEYCSSQYQWDSWSLVRAGSQAFFRQSGESSNKDLWRTDGTPAGTRRLTDGAAIDATLVAHGDHVFFTRGYPPELWKSDGTAAGTVTVAVPAGTRAISMASLGSRLYLCLASETGAQVYFAEGGSGVLTQLSSFARQGCNGEHGFVRLGPLVLFVASLPESGLELWRTDGTPTGTYRLFDLWDYLFSSDALEMTEFQGRVYFFDRTADGRRLLMSTDGTAETLLVKELRERSVYDPSAPSMLVAAGKLFFTGNDGIHGTELWTSDGTAAGTVLVRDFLAGPRSSYPGQLTAAAGRLYFTVEDGIHGNELWQSDGTAAGTRLVQDIAPQAPGSSPAELTVAGERLYFTADDGALGREVWSLPLLASSGCQPSSTRLCLNGGRFQVEARWSALGGQGAGQAVALSADTGYFWFFSADNVEVILKVLDGRGLNEHYWVFYGALSDVEYTLTVTDTTTGLARRYFNPAGRLTSLADTEGFGPRGAFDAVVQPPPAPRARISQRTLAAAKAACQATPTRLCLEGGRFAVEVAFKDFSGRPGTGTAVPLTADTGTFWFFDAANVELVVKVLDGSPVNGKRWVFYGALSSVEYTVTVTDTATGAVKLYHNPSGRLASVADTGAF